jgi:outer membrane protein assembly factor BamB
VSDIKKNKVLLLIFLSLLLFCILAQSIEIQALSEDSLSWSSRRHDAENTGFNQGLAPDTNQTLWTISIGPKSEGDGGGYVPAAAVGDGKMFLGDRNGVLYALNEFNGESLWEKPLVGDIFGPALGYNKVFTIGQDGDLFAIDQQTGEIIWHLRIAAAPSINIADNRLFIAAFNGTFYCVNATSGETFWNRDLVPVSTETYIITHPAIAEGRIFLGGICLNETDGSLLWNTTLNGQTQGIGSRNFPAVAEDRVFIGVNDTLYCLEAFTGSIVWNFTTGPEVWRAPPAIAYGNVFACSREVFYCLDLQNGTMVWNKSGVGGMVSVAFGSTSAGVAVADGKIYLPSPDWAINCLNATNGEVIWRFLTEGPPAPPIVADGSVFVTLVHDPQIYAIGKSPATFPNFWIYAVITTIIVLITIGIILAWRTRGIHRHTPSATHSDF